MKDDLVRHGLEEAFFSIRSCLLFRVALLARVGPLDPRAFDCNVRSSGWNNFVPYLEVVWVEWIA